MNYKHFFVTCWLLAPSFAVAQLNTPDGGEHDRDRAKSMQELVVTASPLQPGSEEVVQPITVLSGEDLDDCRTTRHGRFGIGSRPSCTVHPRCLARYRGRRHGCQRCDQ
jgi:hypothetical protein